MTVQCPLMIYSAVRRHPAPTSTPPVLCGKRHPAITPFTPPRPFDLDYTILLRKGNIFRELRGANGRIRLGPPR